MSNVFPKNLPFYLHLINEVITYFTIDLTLFIKLRKEWLCYLCFRSSPRNMINPKHISENNIGTLLTEQRKKDCSVKKFQNVCY